MLVLAAMLDRLLKRDELQRLREENERLKAELAGAKRRQRNRPRKRGRPRYNYIVRDAQPTSEAEPRIGRGFVYLWLHKVACSSLKDALLPLFDLDPQPYKDSRGHYIVHDVYQDTPYQIARRQFIEESERFYYDHFKFTFVRNPFDRLVSCYKDKIAGEEIPQYLMVSAKQAGVEMYPQMPFSEFAKAVCEIPDHLADGHFRSQHMTVCGPGGEIMADFAGRFENIVEDFDHVKEKIGAPWLELGERNRKASASYREFYDDETREIVAEKYERDLEAFDYSF